MLQLGGYSSSGDGDPIWFTTLDVRFRRSGIRSGPLFLELGTGLGAAWMPSPQRLALPLQFGMGVEGGAGGVGEV